MSKFIRKGIGPRSLGASPLKQTNSTSIKSESTLQEKSKEKGDSGTYKSKLRSTSLHKDESTGTGAFLSETNKEKGEKGSYKSTYKGVTKNDNGGYNYEVSREKGEKGNYRSRQISEKTASRKMQRLEKKYNRKTS